jgi:hypothetical protein
MTTGNSLYHCQAQSASARDVQRGNLQVDEVEPRRILGTIFTQCRALATITKQVREGKLLPIAQQPSDFGRQSMAGPVSRESEK